MPQVRSPPDQMCIAFSMLNRWATSTSLSAWMNGHARSHVAVWRCRHVKSQQKSIAARTRGRRGALECGLEVSRWGSGKIGGLASYPSEGGGSPVALVPYSRKGASPSAPWDLSEWVYYSLPGELLTDSGYTTRENRGIFYFYRERCSIV
jgi:hypothetical protein